MSIYTENLNLLKIIPQDDKYEYFNFYTILNDNWDKLDAMYAQIQDIIQEDVESLYDKTYKIGQPIIRLDNTLYSNEVRLEGAEVLISDYPKLYEVYGNDYGTPSLENTFILPDTRNKTFWGAENFGYIEAGLPNITGYVGNNNSQDFGNVSGAFNFDGIGGGSFAGGVNSGWGHWGANFDASRSNSVYGKSNTVQPPSLKIRIVTRFK